MPYPIIPRRSSIPELKNLEIGDSMINRDGKNKVTIVGYWNGWEKERKVSPAEVKLEIVTCGTLAQDQDSDLYNRINGIRDEIEDIEAKLRMDSKSSSQDRPFCITKYVPTGELTDFLHVLGIEM